MATTILERSEICPPPGTTPEFSLPLLFFDMLFYDLPAQQALLFFDLPGCSESHFLDTIVPDLKTSLSLTLAQFLPASGKIVHPLTNLETSKPMLHYQSGDSVSFTVSKSGADLNHLTGNHPRACDEFYAFAPGLPPATRTEMSICCPVLALQVTLFPGQGLCICLVTHHAVFDASTSWCFIHAWGLINRTTKPGGYNDEKSIRCRLAEANCLPFYDRKTVTNINGLDSMYWDLIVKSSCQVEPPPAVLPINKLRATFVVKKDEIRKLKEHLISPASRLSSFAVICALVWVCSAKSAGDDVADDETEWFVLAADCRGRLDPPLPPNYFGNCVALFAQAAGLKHGQVKGPDGFVMAAKTIGEAIKSKVQSENGILYGAHNWPEECEKLIGKRRYAVTGSPRFDFYAVDYGWGKPKKFEHLVTDDDDSGSVLLSKSRDSDEGDFEIGLSKPMVQMDAFATVFRQVLADLCNSEN